MDDETEASKISIHALREEGDRTEDFQSGWCFVISIHALREEGDFDCFHQVGYGLLFLSTPSARRATSPAAMTRS